MEFETTQPLVELDPAKAIPPQKHDRRTAAEIEQPERIEPIVFEVPIEKEPDPEPEPEPIDYNALLLELARLPGTILRVLQAHSSNIALVEARPPFNGFDLEYIQQLQRRVVEAELE